MTPFPFVVCQSTVEPVSRPTASYVSAESDVSVAQTALFSGTFMRTSQLSTHVSVEPLSM
jgi:hypothetical protein